MQTESVVEVGCGVHILYRNTAACCYALGNDFVEWEIEGREMGNNGWSDILEYLRGVGIQAPVEEMVQVRARRVHP